MGWTVVLQRSSAAVRVPTDGAAVSVRRLRFKKRVVPPFLTIELGNGLARAMGWDDGARIEVAVGGGDQAGRLRLQACAEGAFKLRSNRHGHLTFTVALAALPEGTPDSLPNGAPIKRLAMAAELVKPAAAEPHPRALLVLPQALRPQAAAKIGRAA